MIYGWYKPDPWNRCDYCGRFISYEDFLDGKAINTLVYPDSHISIETWETYHIVCDRDTRVGDFLEFYYDYTEDEDANEGAVEG